MVSLLFSFIASKGLFYLRRLLPFYYTLKGLSILLRHTKSKIDMTLSYGIGHFRPFSLRIKYLILAKEATKSFFAFAY